MSVITEDIDPKKLLTFIRKWWAPMLFACSSGAYLYNTIKTVEAHERRINKLEDVSMATYVNATLACIRSGALGCVTFERFERGDVPRLEAPELKGKQ